LATQDFETLRARVQALGHQLFMDDSCEGVVGDPKSLGEDGPRFCIHDPKKDRHVIIGTGLNIEEWIVEKEDGAEPADKLDVLGAASVPFQAASERIEEARALAALLWNDEVDEHISRVAQMLFTRMNDAATQLNALWVSIGGESAPSTCDRMAPSRGSSHEQPRTTDAGDHGRDRRYGGDGVAL
jgi:hypothetical protein